MTIPSVNKVSVALADTLFHHAFFRSVTHWIDDKHLGMNWREIRAQHGTVNIIKNCGATICADCHVIVSVVDGVLHVAGDANNHITAKGFSEIVVSGSVGVNTTLSLQGISSLYIGGDLKGRIECDDTARIWIDGQMAGSIVTGRSSTMVHLSKDLGGKILASQPRGLLYLHVEGFAPTDEITRISADGYTLFSAAIGVSDSEAGLYPANESVIYSSEARRERRWSVRRQREREIKEVQTKPEAES